MLKEKAVGRKFSHRPGKPGTVGVVRWPSAGDTAGYRLRRPKLPPVSLISFIPGLKPSFSANPSRRSLPFLLQD